jgi:predicted TIM-barrel fold metal-dependent hydrolase
MAGYIDAHVHVWPGDAKRPPFTPADLFVHTRPQGVARVVLIQPGSFLFDNSYLLQAIREHPGVFSGVAVVDLAAPGLPERMRALRGQGVRGFRIAPGAAPGTWLDAESMRGLWRAAAELRMAVCPLVNPDALPALDRMCARHPETAVVIDHLARIGADGVVRDADVRLLCGLARHARVHVKLSAFYALGRKQPPYTDLLPLIRLVLESYGPRRLMWATDSPYQTQGVHRYADSLALVRDRVAGVSAEDRDWLLRRTAERVFFAD